MNYMNDILARLQNGENVEDVASQLTKAINDANELFKKEEEAKRKKAAEKDNLDKLSAAKGLQNAFYAMASVYKVGPEILEAINDIDPEETVSIFDETIPILLEYKKFMSNVNSMKSKKTSSNVKMSKTADPIEDFLNKFVR